jgi:hypothetical protein
MLFDSKNEPVDLWDSSEGIPIAGAMLMIFLGTVCALKLLYRFQIRA